MWKHFEKSYKCTNVGHQHKRIQPDLTAVHSFTVQSTNTLSTCISKTRYCARPPRYKGKQKKSSFLLLQYNTWLSRRLSGKESTCQCRRCNRVGFGPWVEKSPWRRKRQPPPGYSCLGYPMDRGAWWGTVHGATKELDITKAMPKNAQTTAQLHSSHTLVK